MDGGFAVQAAEQPELVVLAADPVDVVLVANTSMQCRARKSNRRAIPPLVYCAAVEQALGITAVCCLAVECLSAEQVGQSGRGVEHTALTHALRLLCYCREVGPEGGGGVRTYLTVP